MKKYEEKSKVLKNSLIAVEGHLIKFSKFRIIEDHKHIGSGKNYLIVEIMHSESNLFYNI